MSSARAEQGVLRFCVIRGGLFHGNSQCKGSVGLIHETYISTKTYTAKTRARVYGAHGDQKWPTRAEGSTIEGALSPDRLGGSHAAKTVPAHTFQRLRSRSPIWPIVK